ncbi:hypothetical protein ES702_04528 [subsurface metagenome]
MRLLSYKKSAPGVSRGGDEHKTNMENQRGAGEATPPLLLIAQKGVKSRGGYRKETEKEGDHG